MSYVHKCLRPDERVIYEATLHWIIYVQGIAFALAGAALGYEMPFIMARFFDPNTAQALAHPVAIVCLLVAMIGIILMLGAYIKQVSTELAITNRRVIAKYGYISRATFEIMIDRVTGANFDQTVGGRLMGYGTIIIHGAGGDISPVDVIANPQGFHGALMGVLGRVPGRGRDTDLG